MTTSTAMVSHLSKSFGAVRAVEDVSFEVYPGEIFGLLGPNGAGKTTSIRMMLDIFSADQGEISVLGGKMDEAKKNRIGYLPEERGLYKDLKLEPTLIFLARLKGLRGGAIEWTKDNHFRTTQYYRVYRWDGAKTAVVKDWFPYEVK